MTYLAVFGHCNIDCIIKVGVFPKIGTAQPAKDVNILLGGVAANIARCAASIGVGASLVSHVGENFPSDLYNQMESEGVDLRFFWKERGKLSPTCYIFNNDKLEQCYIIDQGAMADFGSHEPPSELLKEVQVLHLTTGQPGYYRKLLSMPEVKGKHISFDPAQGLPYEYGSDTDDLNWIIQRANSYFCNEAELEMTLKYLNLERPEDLLDRLEFLVVTLGEKGSRLLCKDGDHRIPAVKGRGVVDPTGAGDSYRAGFFYGMKQELPLLECARLGSTVASFVVEGDGLLGFIPTRDAVMARYKEQNW